MPPTHPRAAPSSRLVCENVRCEAKHCDEPKGSLRNAASAGAHLAFRLGTGLHSQCSLPDMLHTTPPRKLRLAIVTPWIRDSPGAQCWGAKLGKKLGHGEACSAAATSLPASWPLYVGSAEANAQVADFLIMHDALVPPHDFTPKGASKLPGNVKLIAVPNMLAHYRKALRLDVNLTSQKIKDLKAMTQMLSTATCGAS
jgi:hypothetical protein